MNGGGTRESKEKCRGCSGGEEEGGKWWWWWWYVWKATRKEGKGVRKDIEEDECEAKERRGEEVERARSERRKKGVERRE